jgi:hypothetical protein
LVTYLVGRIHRTRRDGEELPVPLGSLLIFISVLSLDGSGGNELAGGQIIEGAEAAGELIVAQAVLAIERSQKLFGGAFPLFRVAIQAARYEVAVGVAAGLRARHNVVDAPPFIRDGAQTIKAAAVLSGVDGLAQGPRSQKILLLEVHSGAWRGGWPIGRNLGARTAPTSKGI